MTSSDLSALVTATAIQHGMDPQLAIAQVRVESGGDYWAWNAEPKYMYLWNVRTDAPFRRVSDAELASKIPPADFPTLAGDPDQEWWAQQASWGLLQIMGAVARERGFKGKYLTELCDPRINLDIGCKLFADLMRWSAGDVRKALAAYNAGKGGWPSEAGQRYATKVLSASGETLWA